ncbi:hypothetical protein SCUCBS95973_001108 [Sporothrix curviconia]|uniref:Uncharacterized protein n=1 Tax=Sporothrix curviconia TaxID=1260050 RepID=A0ABP0AVW1_9PEZI
MPQRELKISAGLRLLAASVLFLALAHFPTAVLADAQCYAINGQKSSGSPCNAAATGQAGSHAACCDESKQEACLATGVCFATQRSDNNTFWAEGCTDPTGLDPSCPQYCGTASPFVTSAPVQATYTVFPCGGSAWCCCFDSFGKSCNKTDCCTKNNFTLAHGLGAVVRQFTANANADTPVSSNGGNTSSSGPASGGAGNGNGSSNGRFSDRNQRLVTAIVAGVLGALLLASLVAFGFSYSRARHLRRQVDRLQQQQTTAGLASASSTTSSPLEPTVSSRSRSLRIETQGLVGVGMVPHLPSSVKDDIVSPISYDQLQQLHQQQQQMQQQYSAGGARRSSLSSFHQLPPPPFAVSQQQQQQQQQQQYNPSQQQPLNGFNYSLPQRSPSWTRGDTIRHNNNMERPLVGASTPRRSTHDSGNVVNTAELATSLHISELPAEKHMG